MFNSFEPLYRWIDSLIHCTRRDLESIVSSSSSYFSLSIVTDLPPSLTLYSPLLLTSAADARLCARGVTRARCWALSNNALTGTIPPELLACSRA